MQAPETTDADKIARITVFCPVCDSPPIQEGAPLIDAFSGEVFPLVACQKCSCLFLSQGPTVDRLPSYYATTQGEEMVSKPNPIFSWLRRIQLKLEARAFERHLSPGARVVDLGAGDGSFIRLLYERGHSTLAVDQCSPSYWHHPEISFVQSDLHGERFQAHCLLMQGSGPDLVIMRHVLEHIYNPALLIRKLHQQNTKYIWVVVPNAESRLRKILGQYWCMWDPPRHLTHFTPKTVSKLLSEAGYEVELCRTYGIDEWVSSFYRYLKVKKIGGSAHWVELFKPKGILAAFSSSLAAALRMNTSIGILAKRVDSL
jgi:23S rRNA U2552 (ribose-2'-O)-methylase RlmE/FtsJ